MSTWSSMAGIGTGGTGRAPQAIRLGSAALRGGGVAFEWWLGPGADARELRDVVLRAGAAAIPADVVRDAAPPGRGEDAHGWFVCPLPAAGLPWVLSGMGPGGTWREVVHRDPSVLDDYRGAVAVGAFDAHDGVRVEVEHVAARPDRLAVFFAVTAGGAEVRPSGIHRAVFVAGARQRAYGPPAASWPPAPAFEATAVYVGPQAAGADAVLQVSRVEAEHALDLSVRLSVPPVLPAVTEAGAAPAGGARFAEACFSRRGLVARFEADPAGAGGAVLLSPPSVATADGRPVEGRGGWSGEREAVLVTGPLPEGATELVLHWTHARRVHAGEWRVPFVVPAPRA